MPTLTYLGHSAFLLENDGKSVVIDPFLSGNSTASHQADQLNPQAILLTHAHNDHVGDTVDIAQRTGAKVIATFELGTWLGEQGVEDAVSANHGGTVAFDGGTVKLTQAWHTSSYEDGNGFVAPGVPAGLVVRFGGKTIYFAGDTCLFGDMRLIGEEGLDVAVLPIGDHFTMGPDDAVRAVEFLNPNTVIPCHYNTFPEIKQDPDAFKRKVEERTAARCEVLTPGASLEL
ncbi:MAG: metal-dependent hydrolase [Chloroflexia bacterium]|nr:metal-dependent hydrolase [Chloroflexia bacterium]